MAYIQYAGSPDIFDEQGNYIRTLDWSKNPQIIKIATPRPDIKTEADFARLAGTNIQAPTTATQPQTQPQPQPQNNLSVPDTGNPELNALLQQTQTYLDTLTKRGETINPSVEISPETTARFLSQAQREISPYYSGQLRIARENLLRQAGYTTDEINASERDIEKKYGTSLRALGETSAETGFAQSGRRLEGEQDLATETQNTIDANRRKLEFEAGNQARQLASEWGGEVLPSATLGSAPRVLAGQSSFQRTGESKPFYSISDSVLSGLTGTQRYNEQAQTRARASDLEENYRTIEANKQRKLNL